MAVVEDGLVEIFPQFISVCHMLLKRPLISTIHFRCRAGYPIYLFSYILVVFITGILFLFRC